MIKVGDVIMDWHNIYIVREIRDDRWVYCEMFRWKTLERKLEIKTEPLMVSLYEKIIDKLKTESEAKLNVVYPQGIKLLIKFVFIYMKGR